MNLLDLSKDNALEKIPTLTWLPWIGKDYFNSNKRLLIIGESHYSDGISDEAFLHNWRLETILHVIRYTRRKFKKLMSTSL